MAGVERHAGEGGSHFEACEAGGAGGIFAQLKNFASDTAARPVRIYIEGADLCGFGCGIEQAAVAARRIVVTAETGISAAEGAPFRPAAAGRERRIGSGVGIFDDEVGLVGDELRVEAEVGAQGFLNLGGRVVRGLKLADRALDEGLDAGNVSVSGEAVAEG